MFFAQSQTHLQNAEGSMAGSRCYRFQREENVRSGKVIREVEAGHWNLSRPNSLHPFPDGDRFFEVRCFPAIED